MLREIALLIDAYWKVKQAKLALSESTVECFGSRFFKVLLRRPTSSLQTDGRIDGRLAVVIGLIYRAMHSIAR